jgi:hypothetical protein
MGYIYEKHTVSISPGVAALVVLMAVIAFKTAPASSPSIRRRYDEMAAGSLHYCE